jgi:pimeloyl-ACP methyl ester carboxylesterase
MEHPTSYRTNQIDGLSISYREAGPKDSPALPPLHGLASSSRMFERLFARLSDQYHLVAPDYPGFGHSDLARPDTIRMYAEVTFSMQDISRLIPKQLRLRRWYQVSLRCGSKKRSARQLKEKSHGNCNDDNPPPFASVHT